jgi:hypothetical protein
MLEEDRIRELCSRVVSSTDSDPEVTVTALRATIKQYLEDQSDELVLENLLKLPDVADAIRKKFPAA